MTRVALLWHMHQPFYQDLVTGEHILPWVRLHGLKDYWGMVAILREFPQVRMTFNLVPSMLVQLEAFARDQARDRHLELGLKPADRLNEDERAFCVEQFFHAHRPRMIDPFPRYAELLAMRGSGLGINPVARAALFSTDDIRDLQVWHKLVWIDAIYFDRDPRVQALVAKGRQFTEDDKRLLREIELEVLRSVVPEYAAAAARGQVELSTSPFYHPILPLLCDTDIYLRTHPHSAMPRERFVHPEDALEQLTRAVELHELLFGQRPTGLWPSEGSVSDAMVPLVARAGLKWMATDEEILARTLGRGFTRDGHGHVEQPEVLYRPYRVGAAGEDVACGFRDHRLSDLIGFTYASWPADAAADDFVARLAEAGRRASHRSGDSEPTVFVILDGENAWEHYDGQGRPFLRAVYRRLSAHPELRTVTMSEACAGASERLPSIHPGSWINGDFYIWIGHRDDHRAWGQLAHARKALELAGSDVPVTARARAREELLIAEGSDWFWWYGDDHSSDHDSEFDDLYRRHVRNVYRELNLPIPDELFVTNISTRPPEVDVQQPTGLIDPVIDGELTSYFEWMGSGCAEMTRTAGAMHQVSEVQPVVELVEFGFDLEALYVRVSGPRSLSDVLSEGTSITISFLVPAQVRVVVDRAAGRTKASVVRSGGDVAAPSDIAGLAAAAGRVMEVRVPFNALGVTSGSTLEFVVLVTRNGTHIEQHPQRQPILLTVPGPEFVAAHWTA